MDRGLPSRRPAGRPACAVESAVADCGVSGVSLRDVARRAGVSHGAPAHHFGSKAGLLTAFATAGYQLLAESVTSEIAASRAADGAAELAAIGRGYVRFAVGHPAHFDVMFRLDALNPANASSPQPARRPMNSSLRPSSAAGRPAACTGALPRSWRSARGRWCTDSQRCGSAGACQSASPSKTRSG